MTTRPVRNTITSVLSCDEAVLERLKQLNTAIKRARFLALVPYSDQHKI